MSYRSSSRNSSTLRHFSHTVSHQSLVNSLRLAWVGLVLWSEIGVFFVALSRCNWPENVEVSVPSFRMSLSRFTATLSARSAIYHSRRPYLCACRSSNTWPPLISESWILPYLTNSTNDRPELAQKLALGNGQIASSCSYFSRCYDGQWTRWHDRSRVSESDVHDSLFVRRNCIAESSFSGH